jgi:hypothetical protein
VISVDTKKKELVGAFKNDGRELRPKGDPLAVNVHDFVTDLGRANPYGVYDLAANSAWVSVGTDHDTASFAVATIRRWWQQMGQARHPNASELTITADCGGSNGYRTRLWKVELQDLADELQIPITVCHLPPGTSKWNRIEHRLFSHITMNWRGKPLILPRSDRQPDHRDHDEIRPHRSGRTRHRPLPQRHQDHRQTDGNARDHPARLPRRLELHDQSKAPTGTLIPDEPLGEAPGDGRGSLDIGEARIAERQTNQT